MLETPMHHQAVASGQHSISGRARGAMMKIIAGQLLAAIALVVLAGGLLGWNVAYSVLVGAGISILPNYFFARRLTRARKDADPERSLREIYVGEFVKIAFTGALFVIAIKLLNIDFLFVVGSFFIVTLTNWVALLKVDLSETSVAARAR